MAMPHYHSFVLLPQTLQTLAVEAPLISLQVQGATPFDMAALERGDIDLLALERAALAWSTIATATGSKATSS